MMRGGFFKVFIKSRPFSLGKCISRKIRSIFLLLQRFQGKYGIITNAFQRKKRHLFYIILQNFDRQRLIFYYEAIKSLHRW